MVSITTQLARTIRIETGPASLRAPVPGRRWQADHIARTNAWLSAPRFTWEKNVANASSKANPMSPTPPAVLSTTAAGFIVPRLRSRAGKRSSSNSGRQRHQVRASARRRDGTGWRPDADRDRTQTPAPRGDTHR
jgi:hypothetical protein